MKSIICLAILILLTAGLWKSKAVPPPPTKVKSSRTQTEDPTTLRSRIKRVKARGDKEVTFPVAETIGEEVNGLDDAVAKYSILLVEPLENISILADPRTIVTYVKFRVLETLSSKGDANSFVDQEVPSELPPLNSNEIYIVEEGGTLEIDGVKVTQKGKYEFSKSQGYLIFVSQSSVRSVGAITLGEYGVFLVKPDSSIEALSEVVTPLRKDLARLHGNSLNRVKSSLKR